MATLIVVPARYGSTRFPGKPLSLILGRSMVSRVAVRARAAAKNLGDAHSVVATDHEDIAEACERDGLDVVMTPVDCPSGSDRALAAIEALGTAPDFILNLQGDAPFVPVEHIVRVAEALRTGEADVATPYIRLGWLELDTFRAQKQTTPFSGTTIIVGPGGRAIWFSKSILPAIRKEADLRDRDPVSPVCRHIGLYGFRRAALERFVSAPVSTYEQLEGLEQLRILESGMTIDAVEVAAPDVATSGIDTPEDLARLNGQLSGRPDPDAAYFAR